MAGARQEHVLPRLHSGRALQLGRRAELGDARGRDPARQVPQPRREAQVLLHREIAVQRRLLEDEADAATGLEVIAYDVVSGDTRRAPSGTQQRGEQMDGGRLAGAVGPEEPEELALPHLEVEVVERADRAEVFAEAAGFDRGGGHSCAASAREAGAAR